MESLYHSDGNALQFANNQVANCNLIFQSVENGVKELGRLTWEDGKLRFEGDVEKSARVFFDYLCGLWNK